MPATTSQAARAVRYVYVTPPAVTGGFDELWGLRTDETADAFAPAGAEVDVVEPGRDHGDADFVTAPNMNYYLAACVEVPSLLRRPASQLWDDPLGALALWSVWRRGGRLGWRNANAAAANVRDEFRAVMSAPGAQHFAFDTGHIDAVVALGLASPDQIEWYPCQTYAHFLEQCRRGPVEPPWDVSFCGNVYESLVMASNFTTDPFFTELTARITARKLADLEASTWDVFAGELEWLPRTQREERGLVPERTEYWDYYLYAVWLAVNTSLRLVLLAAVERPVDVFGMFADPDSSRLLAGRGNLRFRGHAHPSRELPGTYAATKVNICISNALIFRGIPSKLIECVASGGFPLVDPKADLVRLFGPDVEAIVFRSS